MPEESVIASQVAEAPSLDVSRMRELIAERFPEKKEQPPEDSHAHADRGAAPDAASPQEVRGDESAATKEDEQAEKKNEPKRLELKLAKAQAEIRRATAEQVRAKDAAAKAVKELTELRESFSRNPLLALEKAVGRPLREIFEEAKTGKYDVAPEPALPPEIQAIVEREKTRVAEEQAAQAAQEREAEKEQAAPRIRELIDVDQEKYPYLASPGAEFAVIEDLYSAIDKGESPDVQAVIAQVNENAKSRAHFWYSQLEVLTTALRDVNIRSVVEDALGRATKTTPSGKSVAPATTKPPASVGTLSEVGSRRDAPADRMKEIRDDWERARKLARQV